MQKTERLRLKLGFSMSKELAVLAFASLFLAACDQNSSTNADAAATGPVMQDTIEQYKLSQASLAEERKFQAEQNANTRAEGAAQRAAEQERLESQLASQERIAAMNAETERITAEQNQSFRGEQEANRLEAERVKQAGENSRANTAALSNAFGTIASGYLQGVAADKQAKGQVAAARENAQGNRKTDDDRKHELAMQEKRDEGQILRIRAEAAAREREQQQASVERFRSEEVKKEILEATERIDKEIATLETQIKNDEDVAAAAKSIVAYGGLEGVERLRDSSLNSDRENYHKIVTMPGYLDAVAAMASQDKIGATVVTEFNGRANIKKETIADLQKLRREINRSSLPLSDATRARLGMSPAPSVTPVGGKPPGQPNAPQSSGSPVSPPTPANASATTVAQSGYLCEGSGAVECSVNGKDITEEFKKTMDALKVVAELEGKDSYSHEEAARLEKAREQVTNFRKKLQDHERQLIDNKDYSLAKKTSNTAKLIDSVIATAASGLSAEQKEVLLSGDYNRLAEASELFINSDSDAVRLAEDVGSGDSFTIARTGGFNFPGSSLNFNFTDSFYDSLNPFADFRSVNN